MRTNERRTPWAIVVTVCALSVVASACAANLRAPGATGAASTAIARCETVEPVSAPAEWYRESPIYVANEMPIDEVRAWAATKPGFEEIWIDRDHHGWITVAFSADAEARQAELERLFPDVGVVAVGVEWTMAELQEIQRRVGEELGPVFPLTSGISVTQGVVTIGVGVLNDDRIAAVEERFAGERICIEGTDPADAPLAGPQPSGGDGWRLLADEKGAGQPYRTAIATDEASYERLWSDLGLSGEPPAVDFGTEVVIWFGAVYGSSCPNLRLDDVVVNQERSLVHAEIVLVDPPAACTDDANPYAYLVALERAKLPAGPFAIQLGGQDPPPGVPEERTLIDVDLSRPGAVAGPGQVHGDPSLPEPFELKPDSIIEPEVEYPYRLYVHCGIEWLGRFNGVHWRADVPADAPVPPQWGPPDGDQMVKLTLVLHAEPEPVIEATANGFTVRYRPSTEAPPACD